MSYCLKVLPYESFLKVVNNTFYFNVMVTNTQNYLKDYFHYEVRLSKVITYL